MDYTKQELLDHISAQEADYNESYSLYGTAVPLNDDEGRLYVERNRSAYKRWAEMSRKIKKIVEAWDETDI
jgi:hypothetical protein